MATVNFVVTELESLYGHSHQIKWLALANADVGSQLGMSGSPDRSVQVLGTFGSGGTVTIEGSNDGGTTWAALNDPQGNALAITSAGIYQVEQVTQFVRPNVTAGDGTTALDVYAVVRREF